MLDLVVRDVTVYDGSGSAPFPGSVGVLGDRIAWIGRSGQEGPLAGRTLEGDGRALAPGFIDVHSHADLSALVLPQVPSVVRQGITTVVVGNCGSSAWPWSGWEEALQLAYVAPGSVRVPAGGGFGAYMDSVAAARPAVNVASLVGHGTVRREVLGLDRRPPDVDELDRMRGLVADAMEAGAVGLSTGLVYVPGMFASTQEVAALASVAAEAGGLYASHIRGEGRDLFPAIEEALAVGQIAQMPVHVSHLKCESSRAWGRAGELLEAIHGGEDASADQYPYVAWNSNLASLLPPWAPVSELERIAAADRARLRTAVEEGEAGFQSSVDGVGWDRIVVIDTPDPALRGLDVASVGDSMGCDPFEAFLRLLLAAPDVACIGHAMRDDDLATILADPDIFVACDGSATAPDGPGGDLPVHPREYGTFPRALARCREENLLPLERVIAKMTSLPAGRFGLRDRGRIVLGACADLVLLDPAEVADRATYDAPHAFPAGVAVVIVNGQVAWKDGEPAIHRAGRVLRRGI